MRKKYRNLKQVRHDLDNVVLIIGIAGGSGAGKSSLANSIIKNIGTEVVYIQHDSYYKDTSDISLEKSDVNYDEPNAIDNNLLIHQIHELRSGRSIEKPIYDFRTHRRLSITDKIYPKSIIIIEGVLLFTDAKLRSLMDMKIFVDANLATRFVRRLKRDISERERTVNSVIYQYINTVRPMHFKFVEPTKKYADIVVRNDCRNEINRGETMSLIFTKLLEVVKSKTC